MSNDGGSGKCGSPWIYTGAPSTRLSTSRLSDARPKGHEDGAAGITMQLSSAARPDPRVGAHLPSADSNELPRDQTGRRPGGLMRHRRWGGRGGGGCRRHQYARTNNALTSVTGRRVHAKIDACARPDHTFCPFPLEGAAGQQFKHPLLPEGSTDKVT